MDVAKSAHASWRPSCARTWQHAAVERGVEHVGAGHLEQRAVLAGPRTLALHLSRPSCPYTDVRIACTHARINNISDNINFLHSIYLFLD